MKIALASPPISPSITQALYWFEKQVKEAAGHGAEIICFPESFLPGYPWMGIEIEESTPEKMCDALNEVCRIAAENRMAAIVPMDAFNEDGAYQNVAHVISPAGEVIGTQTKNQLDPSEDDRWVPGTQRHLFEVSGLKFGIVICHEGFRYPESVRWAARRGAQVVFHPHCAGSYTNGTMPAEWGSMNNPYYEKAMMMRALENTVYFASVNYAFPYPESASSVIDPAGKLVAHQPYGEAGVLVVDIDLNKATGYLAGRLKPEVYGES